MSEKLRKHLKQLSRKPLTENEKKTHHLTKNRPKAVYGVSLKEYATLVALSQFHLYFSCGKFSFTLLQ